MPDSDIPLEDAVPHAHYEALSAVSLERRKILARLSYEENYGG